MKKILSILLSIIMLFSITAGVDFSIYANDKAIIKINYSPVAPIVYYENTHGYEEYDEQNNEYWHYTFRPQNGDVLTFTYSDNTTKDYIYGYEDFEGFKYFRSDDGDLVGENIYFSSEQNADNIWTAGNEYVFTAQYYEYNQENLCCSISVSIEETPVKSIAFTPREPYEYVYNSYGNYYAPNLQTCDVLTVEYKDGRKIDYIKNKNGFVSKDGSVITNTDIDEYFDIEISDPWVLGDDNYCIVHYLGVKCKVSVNLIESYSSIQESGDWQYEKYSYDDGETWYPYIYIKNYIGNDTDIVIPEKINGMTVRGIESEVFQNNNSITSVKIPGGINRVSGFSECKNLKEVIIEEGVTEIDSWAFAKDSNLIKIVIPKSVTTMGMDAFYFCSNLKSVYYNGSISDWSSIHFFSGGNPVFYSENFFINDELVKNAEISGDIKNISSNAFYRCNQLESVVLNEGIESIGTCAFSTCNNLKTITIPVSVKTISLEAFYAFGKLKDVYYNGTKEDWEDISIDSYNNSLKYARIHCTNGIINCNHTWDDGVITNPPSCDKEGTKIFTCVECAETKIETIPTTEHIPVIDKAKESTCTSTGLTQGSHCSVCNEVIVKQNTISKKAHTYKTTTTKATTSKNGSVVTKCTVCGYVSKTTSIPYIKTVTLSATSYTYDGKVKKPTVTVKDSKGNKIASSNYTVIYQSGRKNAGKYSVKITFKGNYSGTKTLYFTINPKGTSISSVTAKSKGFTVKWKKQTSQTTGYEIQYATDSKFTKNKKTVIVSKNSTTSKTISKLSAKKKYYVRIRTYKTVKVNGKSTKIYSSWSKAKYVTTKK